MAIIKAFIRTSQTNKAVNIRFRFNAGRGVQFYYTSNIMVMPSQWDDKREQLKSKIAISETDRYNFNKSVSDVKTKMMDYYLSLPSHITPTTEGFSAFINCNDNPGDDETSQFKKLFDTFLDSKHYSVQRRKNMMVLYCDIVRYERYISTISGKPYQFNIQTTTVADLRSFERFLETEWEIATTYPELYINEAEPKQRGRNTILLLMNLLRVLFNWLRKQDLTENYPFAKYSIDDCIYGSPIYISIEELHQLKNANLDKRPLLRTQRDIFVFQACIGCRVSDLIHFTGRNVVNGAIEYIARKTREERPVTVRVPINSMAQEIIERYRSSDRNAPLLPFITPQKYNDAIKRAFKAAGLDRTVIRLNPVTREPEQKPLYEVASSHMARKIFIGNIFKKVKDQSLVSELTGHAPNSRAFSRYRNIDDDMKRDMVALLEE